jgi:DNA repair ATPase RecN
MPVQQWPQHTYYSPDYLGGREVRDAIMTDTVDLTVLGRRIERMDDQLHGIVNRLDRIEGSIAVVDSHVGALTAEVHRFGERLDRYDERFDRLEQLLRDRPAPS